MVTELEESDILFIYSPHVVKTGSDVHFVLTELLPRLRPSVAVHFHDIFYPFEYPKTWVLGTNLSWNDAYFLHEFLICNETFRFEFFNTCFTRKFPDAVRAGAPGYPDRFLLNPGGGSGCARSVSPTMRQDVVGRRHPLLQFAQKRAGRGGVVR